VPAFREFHGSAESSEILDAICPQSTVIRFHLSIFKLRGFLSTYSREALRARIVACSVLEGGGDDGQGVDITNASVVAKETAKSVLFVIIGGEWTRTSFDFFETGMVWEASHFFLNSVTSSLYKNNRLIDFPDPRIT
jgi:hypothetical protein